MRSRIMFAVVLAFAALPIGLYQPVKVWSQTRGTADLGPIEIKAADRVDETLFLIRALETMYNNWPGATDTGITAARWAVDQRILASRLCENARKKKLDSDVIDLLEECGKLFQTYDNYLVEIGAVERGALTRAQQERGKLFDKGMERLIDRTVDNWGEKDAGKTIVKETAGDMIAGFVVDLFQQAERDATKKRAIEYAQARYEEACRSTRSQAAATVRRVAKRQKWADGEAGFENATFRDQLQRRPRDPFIRVANALIREQNETAADLMRDARSCLYSARLVPDDPVYDSYRAAFLADAGDLAERAALKEWTADPQHRYGSDLAKEAVKICRTRLVYDGDATDWGKYDLALALNCAGLHGEALNMASRVKKLIRTPEYAYNYACLLSLDGQTKAALEWLEFAFKLGESNVAWAKQDPELKRLRENQAEAFARLTEVKWEWRINYGIFNDDIVLTNKSAFPLTNITVTPTITKNGQTFTKSLTLRYLAPGRSYTWEDVFSIPGSSTDSSVANLTCHQNK